MSTGKIIPIAYPDAFVRYSEVGFQKNILSFFGVGRNGFVKAGHALLLLIENATGNIQYFDFGRYITPYGKGRVRSAITDVELEIPFKAKINSSGSITNIQEILLWLESHPNKTHGEGRMVASVCHLVDYKKAYDFLINLQQQGSVPYKTFGNVGSNCSRLVTDTLIHSVTKKNIVSYLKRNSKFTPSPLGNVKYGANGGEIYEIFNGDFKPYKNSVLKENMVNYFDANVPVYTPVKLPESVHNLQLLNGIGASAYFELTQNQNIEEDTYLISRFTTDLKRDFQGIFKSSSLGFDYKKKYKFIYDCNCSYCHIEQKGKVFRFNLIKNILP